MCPAAFGPGPVGTQELSTAPQVGDAGGEGSGLAEGRAIAGFDKGGQLIDLLRVAIVGPIDDRVDDRGGLIGRGPFPPEAIPFAQEYAIGQHFFDGILRVDGLENALLSALSSVHDSPGNQDLFTSHSMLEIVHA